MQNYMLPEENIGENLDVLESMVINFRYNAKGMTHEKRMDKLEFIKIKGLLFKRYFPQNEKTSHRLRKYTYKSLI